MKKLKSLLSFSVILSCIIGIVYYNHSVYPEVMSTDLYYLGYFSQVPPNYDELLQQTYGESSYYVNFNDIKISIEKTVREKYYIIYSWVSGDESYFSITSIIEHTKKQKLDYESFDYLYIKDNKGKTYLPLPYYSLVDFPPDQPLGWKQILYVKFTPLDEGVKSIDIYITYKGVEKVIKSVPIE
ncbi:MAG: hypothetical protein ACOWWR_17530 [Eubacteriales bacterium]